MDKKLLDALGNVSFALESLVDAIESDKESNSDVTNALKSGDFGKNLSNISVELKSIKSDTSQILKNQETIISLSREKEGEKTKPIEDVGASGSLKKGIGTILLIAGAVLAIGMAFKLVGKVDFLSVISLSLAMTLVSIAFEKIGKLKLTMEQTAITAGSLVIMSIAIAISSLVLSFIKPISPAQLITGVLIGGMFALIGISMGKMISAFEGLNEKEIITAAIFLPLILPAIALGIAGASYALQLVKPISLGQFFTSLMIGAAFVVLSYGMGNIIGAFKDINPAEALVASLTIPILFTAMSFAIMKSSGFLSGVMPIGFDQFLTSIAISFTFVILAYAISPIVKAVSEMDLSALVTLPLLFTTMSIAIMASSHILNEMKELSVKQMIQSAILGGILSIIALVMSPAIMILGELSPGNLLKGGLAIVAISAIITASSQILKFGDYSNYPDLSWILGVGVSITAFGVGALALGLEVFGPQALVFAAGLAAIVVVAATIVAVSKVLKKGDYSNPGMLEWAKSSAIMYATFGMGALALGLMVFGPQALIFGAGLAAMVGVAATIVEISHKLQEGDYKQGPSEAWAKGVGLAIGAFSPVYKVLAENSGWFSSGVSVDDMKSAILTISEGIVDVAKFFAINKVAFDEGSYPSEAWSKGVGLAIGAFSPVYKVLAENSGWFSSGVSVDDMKSAILTISEGIVDVAKFFAINKVAFDEGSYPSEAWSKGVGLAIGAFSPVYKVLAENSGWFSSGVSVDDMKSAILTISEGIVDVAKLFAINKVTFDEDSYPSENWGNGLSSTINSFFKIFKSLSVDSSIFKSVDQIISDVDIVSKVSQSLISVAKMFSLNKEYFSTDINKNYMKDIGKNILDFNWVIKQLVESDDSLISGDVFGKDPITQIAKRMTILAKGYDKLANSLTKLGVAMETLNVSDVRSLSGFVDTNESSICQAFI